MLFSIVFSITTSTLCDSSIRQYERWRWTIEGDDGGRRRRDTTERRRSELGMKIMRISGLPAATATELHIRGSHSKDAQNQEFPRTTSHSLWLLDHRSKNEQASLTRNVWRFFVFAPQSFIWFVRLARLIAYISLVVSFLHDYRRAVFCDLRQ